MALDYMIVTEAAFDGTFTGMAFTRDNSAGRTIARDAATGFPTRYEARKWAAKCRKAQMAYDCSTSR